MTRDEQIDQACRLHQLGLSYNAIAAVMGEYHGIWFAPSTWRSRLDGRVAKRPHGRWAHLGQVAA